ncbi:MAG: hypothetical protein AAGH81_07895 [Bacteroidota bacterium]
MKKTGTLMNKIFDGLLSSKSKKINEKITLSIAIASYLIHLVLIFLVQQQLIDLDSKFFKNPIAAIYTPFSFVLIYEVYLLIFFLPKSISSYIGKQYEIITLIVIRRIFKDLSQLELSSDWFTIKNDLQFTYDVLSSLLLFFFIYLFYSMIKRRETYGESLKKTSEKASIKRFIQLKKGIASLLVPILVGLGVYTFYNWTFAIVTNYENGGTSFSDINDVFFDEFFTVLIIVDVLLLLASFYYSDKFHKIIRNSGFAISTILIKISFTVDGIVNNALILSAVLFGILVLFIHNKFEFDLQKVTGDS